MRKIVRALAPQNSARRKFAKSMAGLFGIKPIDPYTKWVIERKDKLELRPAATFKHSPLVSIIVPAFNTPDKYLYPFVYSVVGQTYQNWELVIVNASDETQATEKINDCVNIDTRIKTFKTTNDGISINTNLGLKHATGEFVAFMDHDDVLELNALEEAVRIINQDPKAGGIYSDEDKITEDGGRYLDPHFKPDWSPHLLMHVNYITHFVVAKKSLVDKVGGLDPGKDGAQDYDLLLKLTDLGEPIYHVPKVLYHWRVAENSTAADISNKPYVLRAGEKALDDHFDRMKIDAKAAAIANMPGFYTVTYKPAHKPTIVVMPFANDVLIKKYLQVIDKRGFLEGYKIITPYEEKTKAKPLEFLQTALEKAGDTVVILNDFVLPGHNSWAIDLAGLLNDNQVQAAAPAVLSTSSLILDMGLVNHRHEKKMLFLGCKYGGNSPFGNTAWPRNVDELTGSVFAARTKDLKNTKLNKFVSQLEPGKYFVAWSNVTMAHVKAPLVSAKNSSHYNPNIYIKKPDLHFYANEQQIMDALLALEPEL